MSGGFHLDLILRSWHSLLVGFGVAVGVSVLAMVLALVLGLAVAGMRLSRFRVLWVPAFAYIQLFRGTSLYVFILWLYFGLAIATGINIPPVPAAVICLGMLNSAYMAEIYRAGVGAIPRGQFEAARALGLSPFQLYKDIIVPQALAVVLPSMMNLFVDLLKDSALISVVGVEDLMRAADRLTKFYFRPFEFFTAASALYVTAILLFSRFVVRGVEARFHPR